MDTRLSTRTTFDFNCGATSGSPIHLAVCSRQGVPLNLQVDLVAGRTLGTSLELGSQCTLPSPVFYLLMARLSFLHTHCLLGTENTMGFLTCIHSLLGFECLALGRHLVHSAGMNGLSQKPTGPRLSSLPCSSDSVIQRGVLLPLYPLHVTIPDSPCHQ